MDVDRRPTSGAFQVTYDTLSWSAAGWSGVPYNELSYYEILSADFVSLAKFDTVQSDGWVTISTNLVTDLGLSAGDTFYFRAVDANANDHYAWMAMDNLQLSGEQLVALGLSAGFVGMRRNRRQFSEGR